MNIEENNKTALESAFAGAKISLNGQPCAFIAAHGRESSGAENKQENASLENEIKESGLSYIKLAGRSVAGSKAAAEVESQNEAFCVIDTGLYSPKDFTKLALYWCNKYNQESVLVTEPDIKGAKPNKLINARGTLYNKNGSVLSEMKNATMGDVAGFFTKIFGKSFAFTNVPAMDIKEKKYDIYNWVSGMGAAAEFKRKYPDLK